MGRFFKELRYSLSMKRHLFFLVLICFVVCGAAWLFQDTLTKELIKAFPRRYAVPEETEQTGATVIPGASQAETETGEPKLNTFRISGKVTQKSPQVTDGDLKAEISFNANLRREEASDAPDSWIESYEEICTEYVQVASFLGPDSAVKGYLTDDFHDNKDVDSNGAKYTTVNVIWMEEKLVEKFHLGKEAKQIFNMPNDYLEKIYVVLGADYKEEEDGYRVGNTLKAKNTIGALQMQVVGFLPKGAKATINGEEVELDSYILCPFISLQDVYEIKEEVPQSYTDGVYLPVKLIGEQLAGAYRNNPPNKKNDTKTGIQYVEVKALFIERSALTEDAPDWLKILANVGEKESFTRVALGASYASGEASPFDEEFEMYTGKSLQKLKSCVVLDKGTTWKIYGMDISLDDYVIFLQPEKKEENAAETNPGEGTEDTPGEDDPLLVDEPVGPKERTFKVEERAKLFHYQFLMNCGYFTTTYTADEAEIELEDVIENSWKDFRRDNPKKDPLTSYRVKEADPKNSILYRSNAPKLAQNILNFTNKGFKACMILFALYVFFKFWRGKEYYSSLYLTGTNRTEMMVLYLIEGILMVALAALCSIGFAFVICKLLQLKMCVTKPLVNRIAKLVGYPTAAIMIWILIRDFGRMFRRTQEV